MDQALALLPADYWRWYLIANSPEGSDSSFTWEHFQAMTNADLANTLGNLVNRVIAFAHARLESTVPAEGRLGNRELQAVARAEQHLQEVTRSHDQMEFRKAAAATRALWSLGNEYVTAAAPWTSIKVDRVDAALALRMTLGLVRLAALVSFPVLPATARRVLRALGDEFVQTPDWPSSARQAIQELRQGASIGRLEPLFARVDEARLEEWKQLFGAEPLPAARR